MQVQPLGGMIPWRRKWQRTAESRWAAVPGAAQETDLSEGAQYQLRRPHWRGMGFSLRVLNRPRMWPEVTILPSVQRQRGSCRWESKGWAVTKPRWCLGYTGECEGKLFSFVDSVHQYLTDFITRNQHPGCNHLESSTQFYSRCDFKGKCSLVHIVICSLM